MVPRRKRLEVGSSGAMMLRVISGAVLVLLAVPGLAQYCTTGTTYFGANFFGACTVGSCWSPTPFAGSTTVSPTTYPSGNYTCATVVPETGALENTLSIYDGNGNLTQTKDPLGRITTNTFDALNRLTQVLDPVGGTTGYGYTGNGVLKQVTDPRGLVTTYSLNGFGETSQLVSPDTGTTSVTYDPVGNVATRIDARGVTATQTYDVLNRVTQIVFSKAGTPTETHGFEYDGGPGGAPNAKGRPTKLTDYAGVTTWTYEAHGRVTTKSQTVAGITRTIAYAYNSAGQLQALTTPSGQVLNFTYANNRVAGITINGQTLITQVTPDPFGPLSAWQWGNGLKTYRDYDLDGRLASWEFRNGASMLRKDQTFDSASRITAIADPANPTLNQSYGYDALDRLTQAQWGIPLTHTQLFGYDATGNRTTFTVDANWVQNQTATTSNRLQSVSGSGVSAATYGGYTDLAFTYNNANRLTAITSGGATLASYMVNGLGQRVSKTAGGATTLFLYDEQGRLLGEYDGAGNLIQETVWLEDLPIATLRPTGGGGNPSPINTYYVHTDHLGSPRAITRPSDNIAVWTWDNVDPFGANPANESPTGLSPFKYGLRFPGQYYDAETGTHYNYFRDYDPGVGRYLESDPIGLYGGLNTFGYANGAPILGSDELGLATYTCKKPLHACGNSGLKRCFADIPGNPFYHQYICVIWPDGSKTCGGQDRSGNAISSPGRPSSDAYPYNRPDMCDKRDDRPCVDACVQRRLLNPVRPRYGIPFGVDCQEWSDDVLHKCQRDCGMP